MTLGKSLDLSEPYMFVCETARTTAPSPHPPQMAGGQKGCADRGFMGGLLAELCQHNLHRELGLRSATAVRCVYTADPQQKPWTPGSVSFPGG